MHALCPSCGLYHEVVRVLDDGHGDSRRDVYQVAPLVTCQRSWVSDEDLVEARGRFGREALVQDDEPD